MALLYDATLKPTKLEVLQGWASRQPWFPVEEPGFEVLGRLRFDDPDGEVGIETFLLRHDSGAVLHVPLTYRGAPLEDGDLVSTMEHSVLGDRWVYDAVSDPVYRAVVAEVIATGGQQATAYLHNDEGPPAELPSAVRAWGVPGAGGDLDILRVLDLDAEPPASGALLAQWEGRDTPVALVLG